MCKVPRACWSSCLNACPLLLALAHACTHVLSAANGTQWEKLPALVALMREMVSAINLLYCARSKVNKDAASNLLRQLVFDWDFGVWLCICVQQESQDVMTDA